MCTKTEIKTQEFAPDSIPVSTPDSIPVIDLKSIWRENPRSEDKKNRNGHKKEDEDSNLEIATQIVDAFSTVGFVYLKNHDISPDVIDSAFQESKHFFSLPTNVKIKTPREVESRHGYVAPEAEGVNPSRTEKDLKECFDVTKQGSAWPHDPPSFRAALLRLFHACAGLSASLLRLVATGLKLKQTNDFLQNHDLEAEGNTTLLRTLYYPLVRREEMKEDQVQLGEHSDYGTLTLLFQRDVGGLEVQTRRGGCYVSAPPIPGTILVNIGSLLERWTNGALRATYHRVISPLEKERQSIAFFVHPREDLLIERLELEGANRVTQEFEPITAKDYFDKRFAETFDEKR